MLSIQTIILGASIHLIAFSEAIPFELSWKDNILTISGDRIPGGPIKVWYIEAYCRPGSTDRDWGETTIGHTTRLIHRSKDNRLVRLQCRLKDDVVVDHELRAVADGISFEVTARNRTKQVSQVHWAQPCIRVDTFTGKTQESYLPKCFIFLDDKLQRMPTPIWARKARYTPGQVWAAPEVDRDDVNPRPLNPLSPSVGLIGCYSADEKMILATAWEPYQELFQGVITCIHSDFRIGGLLPGETKKANGRLYIVKADVDDLLRRYGRDFRSGR